MGASPLSKSLMTRAAEVAKATGVAMRIEARGVILTVLPDDASHAQPAASGAEESAWDKRIGGSA